jgi:glycosyltransferase involved in cell wall biosynthesis
LLVVQPSVSHYREPLIRELLDSDSVNFRLVGKLSTPDAETSADRIQVASDQVLGKVHPLKFVRRGVLVWERGVIFRALAPDVVVLEGRIFTASTWGALLLRRILRRPTLLWTHGWRGPDAGLKRVLRLAFYRLANGLLLYGPRARHIGQEAGYPDDKMTVIGNSIYSRADTWPEQITQAERYGRLVELGLDPELPTVLTVSRLSGRKSIELLIQAVDLLGAQGRPVNLLVVGEGSERPRLETLTSQGDQRVVFYGPAYGAGELRRLHALADLSVCPGAAGLSVVQSLGFGVPVVAHDNDSVNGPETDVIDTGVNGARFREGDPEDLIRAMEQTLELSRSSATVKACVESVAEYTAESHSIAIVSAVIDAASRRGRFT